jgi:hypothetical protein
MERILDTYELRSSPRSVREGPERAYKLRVPAPRELRSPKHDAEVKVSGCLDSRLEKRPPSAASLFDEILIFLDSTTRSFLKTADDIASYLRTSEELDWSVAVMPLCKAFERETVQRILNPLRAKSDRYDLSEDLSDNDLGRVAKFCVSSGHKPPELGTFGHFLKTAIHSVRRRNASGLLKAFYDLISQWPQSSWLIDTTGLVSSIERLTTEFRNRAAHIERLMEIDFRNCRTFVRDDPHKIIVVVATR